MKVRNGFVSNSSSSSFIIAIPEGVNSLGQLQDYLFGDATRFGSVYGENNWPVSDITSIVYRDIKGQVSRSLEDLAEENTNGWTEENIRADRTVRREFGVKNIYELRDNEWHNALARLEKLALEYSKDKLKKFMENNPYCDFFVVEYSDNDGALMSAMEHGGLFDRISHIRISKH